MMSAAEQVVFRAFCSSARRYVEFGSGGSTCVAAETVTESVVTIDSDLAWLEAVLASCRAVQTPVVPVAVHIDLGQTGAFGYPLSDACREAWPAYHERVWSMSGTATADLYMVDGRFRISCLLQALLNGPTGSRILFHDYFGRPGYHVIEPFVQEICRVDQLAVFQRKGDFDRTKAAALLQTHRFDVR